MPTHMRSEIWYDWGKKRPRQVSRGSSIVLGGGIEVLSPAYCILRDPDDPNAAEFTAHFNKLKMYNADDPSNDTQYSFNVTRPFSDGYLQPIPDPSDDPS